MVGKKIGFIVVFILVASISFYFYMATRVIDPFIIDASKGTVEKAAPDLLNTNQDYYFRLTNYSDKPVKLIDIQLSGYSGIEVGKLSYKGVTPNGLEIPSHRIYTPNGWTNNNQGLEIQFVVTIKESKMINPKTATITYSYLGIKHKQVVQIPGM
jgi:hypothetical protein